MKEHKEADAGCSAPFTPFSSSAGPGTGFPVQAFVFVFNFKEKKKSYFLKIKEKYEIITKYLNFLTFIFKVDDC